MHPLFFVQPLIHNAEIWAPRILFQTQLNKSTFITTPQSPLHSFHHPRKTQTRVLPTKIIHNTRKRVNSGIHSFKMAVNTENVKDAQQRAFKRKALIALLSVPPMWGSYTVLGRVIFNNSDTITPSFMNMFGYGWSFIIINILQIISYYLFTQPPNQHSTHVEQSTYSSTQSSSSSSSVTSDMNQTSIFTPQLWLYGFELCLYIVIGNLCELAGLQNATASRTAFLVQTTTVMVPLLELVIPLTKKSANAVKDAGVKLLGIKNAAQSPDIKVDFNPWTLLASVLALFGLGIFSGSGQTKNGVDLVDSLLSAWTPYDFMVLIGAAFYSVHVLRLGYITRLPFLQERPPNFSSNSSSNLGSGPGSTSASALAMPAWLARASPITLLTITKSACQFLTTLVYLLFEQSTFVQQSSLALPGKAPFSLSDFVAEPKLYSILLPTLFFLSTFGCGISNWLQSYGQRGVPSSIAAVIYAFQPVWASVFAAFALREFLSPNEYIGGAIIVVACIMASKTSKQ